MQFTQDAYRGRHEPTSPGDPQPCPLQAHPEAWRGLLLGVQWNRTLNPKGKLTWEDETELSLLASLGCQQRQRIQWRPELA